MLGESPAGEAVSPAPRAHDPSAKAIVTAPPESSADRKKRMDILPFDPTSNTLGSCPNRKPHVKPSRAKLARLFGANLRRRGRAEAVCIATHANTQRCEIPGWRL